ncbi:response regulator [Aquincola sp. S2]|uniref:Response regulator n=1 Tax=Pseudaquabacterium terrae TaxID=2732868 RepID=A0ABX2EC93_9BURK|nr:response regulator [Aquabacterium terrae]NRF66191.1 response regulator [Aquabacterium terrae]
MNGALVHAQRARLAAHFSGLNASAFVIALQPDGTVLRANEAALELVGAAPDEVTGRPLATTAWGRHLPPGSAALQGAIERGRRGEAGTLTLPIKTAQAQRISVDFTLQPVPGDGGEPALLMLSGRDVPERHRAPPARDHGALLEAQPPARLPHVLVVDDDEALAQCLGRKLQRHFGEALTVEVCADAQAALARLHTRAFDIVVSDLDMPALDGITLLGHARALQPNALRILLLGASDMTRVLEAEHQVDVFRHLSKPWSTKQFQAHFQAALQQLAQCRDAAVLPARAGRPAPQPLMDAPIAA